jgi:hypothetical protein
MNHLCPDCLVNEGEIHLENCDQEICSKCGKQVLAWGKCEGAKPEPFFSHVGFFCERCGDYMPEFFKVSNQEWAQICGKTYALECVLCKKCFDFIKEKRGQKDKEKTSFVMTLDSLDGCEGIQRYRDNPDNADMRFLKRFLDICQLNRGDFGGRKLD